MIDESFPPRFFFDRDPGWLAGRWRYGPKGELYARFEHDPNEQDLTFDVVEVSYRLIGYGWVKFMPQTTDGPIVLRGHCFDLTALPDIPAEHYRMSQA